MSRYSERPRFGRAVADNNPVTWILAGGGGTIIGSLVMSIVQTLSGKGESRGHAADLITGAASKLSVEQSATIERLERQAERQRKAVLALTNLIEDELLPQLSLPPAERTKLRKALTAVKLAI